MYLGKSGESKLWGAGFHSCCINGLLPNSGSRARETEVSAGGTRSYIMYKEGGKKRRKEREREMRNMIKRKEEKGNREKRGI